MNEREALADLLEVVEAAIKAGDWKVDGACDPDLVIRRAKEALAQPEPVQVTINDFVAFVKDKEDWVGRPVYWAQWPNEEKNKC